MAGAQELIEHFRKFPAERHDPPEKIAERLGIDRDFVTQVMRWLPESGPGGTTSSQGRSLIEMPAWLGNFLDSGRQVVLFTTIGMFVVWAVSTTLNTLLAKPLVYGTLVQGTILVTLSVIQMVSVYRSGSLGYAAKILSAYSVCVGLTVATHVKPFRLTEEGIPVAIAIYLLLLVIAIPFAVLGGYHRVRVAQQNKDRMPRQAMLERLFELRDRLQESEGQDHRSPEASWLETLRARRFPLAIATSIVVTGISLIVFSLVDPKGLVMSLTPASDQALLFKSLFMLMVSSVINVFVYILVGYVAGTPARAVVVITVYAAVAYALIAVWPGPYGWQSLQKAGLITNLVTIAGHWLFALIGGLVGAITEHNRRTKLLSGNDPAMLVAEITELEWKLRPTSHRVCVMVVDAARSSLMKLESDPFEAEWSFREYQALIERVSTAHLGSVHATAGDGAVVGFSTAAEAYAAACELQKEIEIFNATKNRIKRPFRLRIGLHSGEVQGLLDQVQFTEVIDIAAHVEGCCPIGKVAMTARVAVELPHIATTPIGAETDGFDVYVGQTVEFVV